MCDVCDVSVCAMCVLTKSPSALGMQMFISEDLAVIISAVIDSLLKNTWHPSVLSMETVGHLPITCKWRKVYREGEEGGREDGGACAEDSMLCVKYASLEKKN